MNYTQTFEEFATKLGPTDLALYAGVGLVIWVLFKDKLSPVQKLLGVLVEKIKNVLGTKSLSPVAPSVKPVVSNKEDVFFQLVLSWKQTRDLAVKSGCNKAAEVADQMFPYLSPVVCEDKKETV
jgi:hypothetical protein